MAARPSASKPSAATRSTPITGSVYLPALDIIAGAPQHDVVDDGAQLVVGGLDQRQPQIAWREIEAGQHVRNAAIGREGEDRDRMDVLPDALALDRADAELLAQRARRRGPLRKRQAFAGVAGRRDQPAPWRRRHPSAPSSGASVMNSGTTPEPSPVCASAPAITC